ncbi:MAG: anti-sigma factor [Chitinophagaceae bacterium]
MDLSCIILSGDLELYLLGLLPKEETEKVDALIILFPEIKAEVDRISETLEAVSSYATVMPGPHVKENLFKQLKELKSTESVSSTEIKEQQKEPAFIEKDTSPGKVVSMKRSGNNSLLAAAIIGLVLSIGAVIYLATQNSRNNQELVLMEQRVNELNTSLNQQEQQNLAYSQLMQIMQDPNYTHINLQQVPGKPEALVKVFWNKQSNEVYLFDVSLPEPPSNKQYQLWAIVDGKPVSAGVFDNAKQRAQKMQDFAKADAFAITLEQRGGSAEPTMEEMYVIGTTS